MSTWRSRIDELERGDWDFLKAAMDSHDWDRCAIGERREVLEAKGAVFCRSNYPLTEDLYILGVKFDTAISKSNWVMARGVLDQIDSWIASHPTIADPSSQPAKEREKEEVTCKG